MASESASNDSEIDSDPDSGPESESEPEQGQGESGGETEGDDSSVEDFDFDAQLREMEAAQYSTTTRTSTAGASQANTNIVTGSTTATQKHSTDSAATVVGPEEKSSPVVDEDRRDLENSNNTSLDGGTDHQQDGIDSEPKIQSNGQISDSGDEGGAVASVDTAEPVHEDDGGQVAVQDDKVDSKHDAEMELLQETKRKSVTVPPPNGSLQLEAHIHFHHILRC